MTTENTNVQAPTAQDEEQFLSADAILSSSDLDWITIPVKEWGGSLCAVAMSGEEAIRFYRDLKDPDKKDEAVIRLFTLSIVNNPTDRKRIFNEAKIEALKKKKFGVFLRIQDRLLEFNGMKAGSEKTAKND